MKQVFVRINIEVTVLYNSTLKKFYAFFAREMMNKWRLLNIISPFFPLAILILMVNCLGRNFCFVYLYLFIY